MAERPEVPEEMAQRCDRVLGSLPRCAAEDAWVGVRWRVGSATVAHLFGGEDQRFRVVFRADPEEVMAFEAMGEPYFRAGWGTNVVGLVLDEATDWDEVAELLVASYCVQAPARLAEAVMEVWAPQDAGEG
ncbi:MmcQ/YjbR family DNA-binding protein [Ornithinicoccus hortensis]|uniref:YjbR protein n=1 Tax=Ornithinicoccus hortensis TaxID=82346 RepID=A0A542YTF7_9MICO|nr:MmcQ/YjbR family DNA-binding protein [Ornithinicoccus hortensis]TQL51234.1 YjbR protein [Ornithinicoccus hortensis]